MNRNKRAIARQATSTVAIEGPLPENDDPLLSFTPIPHVAPRRNSITPERQRAFIAHLAATGIVKQAAKHIRRQSRGASLIFARPSGRAISSLPASKLASLWARVRACGPVARFNAGLQSNVLVRSAPSRPKGRTAVGR